MTLEGKTKSFTNEYLRDILHSSVSFDENELLKKEISIRKQLNEELKKMIKLNEELYTLTKKRINLAAIGA